MGEKSKFSRFHPGSYILPRCCEKLEILKQHTNFNRGTFTMAGAVERAIE